MTSKLMTRLAVIWRRRFFYLSTWFGANAPVHNISFVPDGFRMQRIGRTGIRVVDQFCTETEAAALLDTARERLAAADGDALVNDVRSSGALNLAGTGDDDSDLLPLLYRCGLLFGVPYTHVERIVLVRAHAGSEHDPVDHYAPAFDGGNRHGVLICLNEPAGEVSADTIFGGMHLRISPRTGRAVCWTLGNGLATADLGLHEQLPAAFAEKWLLQIWLGDKPLRADSYGMLNPPQARQGKALEADATAPEGVWAPQDIDLEAVFGQPDKLKGLV